MASTKEIKRRIKSVKSTKKITKAMELVAASKMKRAVSSTLASRLYAEYSWEILTSISKNIEKVEHPLFIERDVKKILLLVISSNRGLCGAYNTQIMKKVLSLFKNGDGNKNIDIITIGKKGDTMIRRIGKNVIASFFETPANISLSDVTPISEFVINKYNDLSYDKVFVAYTDYISALSQKPNIKQIIPVSKTSLRDLIDLLGEDHHLEALPPSGGKASNLPEKAVDYLFEGDQNKLIGTLAEKLTRMQIYQMLLESNASEQSSRMIAMKNASEAAGEMIDDLTLVFNKARQSNITREISEISAGMASVS